MTIYIGNLSFQAEQEDLLDLFSQYGEVKSASLPLDRETGRKRGFGFVEMNTDADEQKAIDDLQNVEWMGRMIRVNKATPRERTGGGGGGGGRGGYGGGGGGGYGGGGGGNRWGTDHLASLFIQATCASGGLFAVSNEERKPQFVPSSSSSWRRSICSDRAINRLERSS